MPYLVANLRQVSNLAVVRFASGADFDTLAVHGPVGDLYTNLDLGTAPIGPYVFSTTIYRSDANGRRWPHLALCVS